MITGAGAAKEKCLAGSGVVCPRVQCTDASSPPSQRSLQGQQQTRWTCWSCHYTTPHAACSTPRPGRPPFASSRGRLSTSNCFLDRFTLFHHIHLVTPNSLSNLPPGSLLRRLPAPGTASSPGPPNHSSASEPVPWASWARSRPVLCLDCFPATCDALRHGAHYSRARPHGQVLLRGSWRTGKVWL